MSSQNLFVSTEWLAENLDRDDLRIVDIRGHVLPASEPPPHYFSHYAEYQESHITGAVFVDWTKDIVDPNSPSQDVALPDDYAEFVGQQLGIDEDTFVVVYDNAQSMFAARFWWTMQYYGHEKVAVLDGGWNKWIAENHPTTAKIPNIQPKDFPPKINASLLQNADNILQNLKGAMHLMDVRSPQEFAGESSRANRKGHIPGAFNLSRKKMVAQDGTILSPEQLQEIFSPQGLTETSDPIVVYCNAGVSASFGLMALHSAGLTNSSIYDGSWKNWGNDESKPIDQ